MDFSNLAFSRTFLYRNFLVSSCGVVLGIFCQKVHFLTIYLLCSKSSATTFTQSTIPKGAVRKAHVPADNTGDLIEKPTILPDRHSKVIFIDAFRGNQHVNCSIFLLSTNESFFLMLYKFFYHFSLIRYSRLVNEWFVILLK